MARSTPERIGRLIRERREAAFIAGLIAIFSATAALYLAVPIAGRFGHVFLGTAVFAPDAFLNAGVLEWGFVSLRSAGLHFFDWTAGFPLSNTLAATENLVGWQLLYTPLRLLGAGVPTAYNLLMLASLVISGVGAALLGRRLGADRAGAAVAGFIFAFAPFHLGHMIHLQTMGVCWSPFAVLFLDRYLETQSVRDAVGLAVAFVLSALSVIYFAVFLALLLPMYVALCWIFGRYKFSGRALAGLVITGSLSALVLLPLIIPYARFAATYGYRHDVSSLTNFSMELLAPIRMPDWLSVWSWTPLVRRSAFTNAQSYSAAFPGVVALGLALYAIVVGRRQRASRATVWVLVSLTLICYLLALGPTLRLMNLNPSRLVSWIPMPGKIFILVPGICWPMRVFFFALLGGAILSGLGLTAVLRNVASGTRAWVTFGILVLIAVEYRPASWLAGRSADAPAPMEISDAYPYLAREADRGGVVELPVTDKTGWRTPMTTRYTYGSAGHLRRIVALHGNVMPPVIDSLMRAASLLPAPASSTLLLGHGVTRVVVHPGLMPEGSGASLVQALRRAGYPVLFMGREDVVFQLRLPGITVRSDPAKP